MRSLRLVSLATILLNTIVLAQSTPVISPPLVSKSAVSGLSQPDPAMQGRIAENYGKLPLSFEANHGQADGRVKFLSRTGGYTLFLTGDEAVLAMRGKNAKKSSPQGPKPASLASSSGTAKAAPFPRTIHGTSSIRDDVTAEDTTGSVLRMKLRNANPAAKVTGLDELAGTSNYFIGNDPAKWRSNVPTYAKVKYEEIYSGIDLVYYGTQQQLEYDFIVAPGADPRRIVFDVRGAKRIRRDEHGDLVLKMKTGDGEIRWHKPVVYQEKDGARQEIAARYAITDTNRVGFEVAKYDPGRPLYIDPLIYSTYLGGNSLDRGFSIAADGAGNAYVTGQTLSTDFPTMNPLQANYHGGDGGDAFVAKINSTGSALVYSTYLGGSGDDQAAGIAVDSAGNAYVTGITNSTDFPTMNPLQSANGGGYDAFVAALNPTGSALVYSTYLGGSGDDGGSSVAVDTTGNAYVAGFTRSADFPTKNPLQAANAGFADVFVAKINSAGSMLVYSTYLGGSGDDGGSSIAVDSAGRAYVTGLTYSTDFRTKNPLQPNFGGGDRNCLCDAFVAKINPTGSALVYSTYLGGSGDDQSTGIAVDSAGNAYVTGFTTSTDFPTKNPLQPAYGGNEDAFVAKINPTGSTLVYSTYLGGSGGDGASGIAVDSGGNAYVTGFTNSNDFPITPGAFQTVCNNGCGTCVYSGARLSCLDIFVTRLTTSGSVLVYSTYLGGRGADEGFGIAVGSLGDAYVTGITTSPNFPTKNPLQAANGGGLPPYDGFVTKIDVRAVPIITLSASPNPSIYGQAVNFTAMLTSTIGVPPDGETVTFMKGIGVLGTAALSGGSASFETSTLRVGTNTIKAVYGGDSNFLGGTSKNLSQVVSKATTTTTLGSSQNPSNSGQSVAFTASVAPQFSGKVTGTVTFYDGTTALKTASLSGGMAKFTTSTLTSGKHSIKATYNGSTNFIGSSASLTQTVN